MKRGAFSRRRKTRTPRPAGRAMVAAASMETSSWPPASSRSSSASSALPVSSRPRRARSGRSLPARTDRRRGGRRRTPPAPAAGKGPGPGGPAPWSWRPSARSADVDLRGRRRRVYAEVLVAGVLHVTRRPRPGARWSAASSIGVMMLAPVKRSARSMIERAQRPRQRPGANSRCASAARWLAPPGLLAGASPPAAAAARRDGQARPRPRGGRDARPHHPPRHPLRDREQLRRHARLQGGARVPAAAGRGGARARATARCAAQGYGPRCLRRLPALVGHEALLGRRRRDDQHEFVADPRQGSKHNRGCAVDLSLYDLETGREVEMPSAYDEMTERAYPDYEGGTAEARAQPRPAARGDGGGGLHRRTEPSGGTSTTRTGRSTLSSTCRSTRSAAGF